MKHLHDSVSGLFLGEAVFEGLLLSFEYALVVARHDLGEPRQCGVPVGEEAAGHLGVGLLGEGLDQRLQFVLTLLVDRRQFDKFGVGTGGDEVEHPGDAAGHTGREVATGGTEDDHTTAGHVLTAVVADTLGDDAGAGVAYAAPFADPTADEDLTAGRAVRQRVAGDDVLLGPERRGAVRTYDQTAARQALADVVVGVALDAQRHALRHERTERVARRTRERQVDGALRQALTAVALGDLVTQQRADGAVDVADAEVAADRLTRLQRRLGDRDQ